MTTLPADAARILGRVAIAGFGLVALAYLTIPAIDADYGWHIANGRHLLDGTLLRGVDTYSWTAAGAPWIAHEWLTEGLMAAVQDTFGRTANSLLFGAAAAAAIVLVVDRLRRRGFGTWVALGVGVVALLDAGTIVSVRPIVVEVLAVAGLLWVLDAWRDRRIGNRRLAVIVLVGLLGWVNAHGSFVLGIAILGATWLGLVADRDPRRWRILGLTAAAVGVSLANPFGLELWRYVATATSGTRLDLIQEWRPPDLTMSMWWAFATALGLAILGTLAASVGRLRRGHPSAESARRARIHLDDVLIAAGLAVLGLQHAYHAGLFGIVGAPLVAVGVRWIEPARVTPWRLMSAGGIRERLRHRLRGGAGGRVVGGLRGAGDGQGVGGAIVVGIVAVAVGILVWARVGPANTAAAVAAAYPVGALPALDALAAERGSNLRLVNRYAWGGWLEMERPGIPVFIDGRSEVYGDAQIDRYVQIIEARPAWDAALIATGANAALIAPDVPLATELRAAGWEQRYGDAVGVLLTKPMRP